MNEEGAGAIETLLVETESAHAVYERDELGGVYDDAWPAWYARYAVDHGLGDILGRTLAADELTAYFARGWEEVKGSAAEPKEPWSTWMARRLANDL